MRETMNEQSTTKEHKQTNTREKERKSRREKRRRKKADEVAYEARWIACIQPLLKQRSEHNVRTVQYGIYS